MTAWTSVSISGMSFILELMVSSDLLRSSCHIGRGVVKGPQANLASIL
jgi:hypothetical protein